MKRLVTFLLVLVVLVSCKEDKKENTEPATTTETVEPRKIEDVLAFENLLKTDDIDGAEYGNIEFSENGAIFKGDENNPSYINLPLSNLDLGAAFNVSFSYQTNLEIGSKSQTFIAFADKYSSPSRSIPLYIYSAGKRVTGVYGEKKLWAENYDVSLGESKIYYDSYQLSHNEVYFVSVNFTGSQIDVYVNSELYASFPNIEPHQLQYSKVVLGALPMGEGYTTLFDGVIHGIKMYSSALTEKEIVDVYNDQPY